MFGEDLAPHRYDLMETCADHLHWAGGRWQDSREGKGKHGEAGGGHAHVGGDDLPGRQLARQLSQRRLHVQHPRPPRQSTTGSIAGRLGLRRPARARTSCMVDDPWFRGLELKYGPDGGVYLTDWSDTGECHETDADNAHRENGRIYKISLRRRRSR